MKQYLELLQDVIKNGAYRCDRTEVGTYAVFGRQMRFDLQQGFPLLTTKKIYVKGVIHELLWFLRGDTNIKYLQENNVHIWDEWADDNGELGPVYGAQWRNWQAHNGKYIDQIKQLIKNLKNNPASRRHIVSAWNVGQLENMALPPCHCLVQFFVQDDALSCQLYQRSADIFLGVPFNIASYALLTHMVAAICGYKAKEFIWTGGDVHIYKNHLQQAKIQLEREPKNSPQLEILHIPAKIEDFTYECFNIKNYDPHAAIKAPIAV